MFVDAKVAMTNGQQKTHFMCSIKQLNFTCEWPQVQKHAGYSYTQNTVEALRTG